MKVLITDPVDEQCLTIFREEGFVVDYRPGLKAAELSAAVADADALVVRSQTNVTPEIVEAGKRLKVIGRAGAGVDNIDLASATRRGIVVMNTPGGNTISTAEHTLSMILALARNIPQANQSLREGKWDRKQFVGTELFEKTLGIVGLGKVGAELARRCRAFSMTLIAFDPMVSSEQAAKAGIELVTLEEIYRRSDFISLHTPLTPETKGIINSGTLARCKRGVRIVNCARGGIVVERDLLAALNEGAVGGAALDVFESEPPVEWELIRHPHVVATPHLAASTEEAQEKVAVQISRQIADFLKERGITGSVNGDLIRYTFRAEFRPYLELAERLGSFVAQMKVGELKSVLVSVHGPALGELVPMLDAVVLKGILAPVLAEPVNYLNSVAIAKERGIGVRAAEGEPHEFYPNVVEVRYETTKEARTLAGTVFGSTDVRIIGIDGFHFEMRPHGNLLLYGNIDRPGMLAKVSGVLARGGINIGGLSLGRHRAGFDALTVIALDEPPAKSVIEEIEQIEGVSHVKLIAFP
jgi:D-3-phosphoglycerate dehydrogenase